MDGFDPIKYLATISSSLSFNLPLLQCLRILPYTTFLLKVVYVFVECLSVVERKKLLSRLFLHLFLTHLDFTILQARNLQLFPPSESSPLKANGDQLCFLFIHNFIIIKHPLNGVKPIYKVFQFETPLKLRNFNFEVAVKPWLISFHIKGSQNENENIQIH